MTPAIGTKVRVHFNLFAADKGEPAWIVTVGGLKVCATDSITIANAKPVYWVGRDGRDGKKPTGQYLSTHGGKRTVHAWIEGVVCAAPAGDGVAITYNPKRSAVFHERLSGKEYRGSAWVSREVSGYHCDNLSHGATQVMRLFVCCASR